jgi:hypothetical protein
MLRAHRLLAVRIPLPCFGVALLSAAALALGASVDPPRAAASLLPAAGLSVPTAQPVSRRHTSHGKSSPARQAKCAAAARSDRRSRARKACAGKRSKTNRPKSTTSLKPAAAAASVAVAGVPAPVIGGAPPAEAFEVAPTGPVTPDVPVVTTPVSEPESPKLPIEELTPRVEELTQPIEEVIPPIEESKLPTAPVEPEPPAEEFKPPGEESKLPPLEESTQPIEELIPPIEESKPSAEEKARDEKVEEEQAEALKVEEEKTFQETKAKEVKAREVKAQEERVNEEAAEKVKAEEEKAREEKAKEESAAPFRFFSPTSFWNEELPTNAPLDASSTAIMGAFGEEIAKEEASTKQPTINTTAWSVPFYTVPADQPLIKVTQTFPYGGKLNAALQTAWEAVPLPPGAQPAAGTDEHLVVWQPSTNKLWEFWHLEKTEEGWQAKWGGAIDNESADSGAYGPEAWSGAQTGWGASASSLSIAGGLMTLEDLEKGQINHALAMALPDVREGVYASPAERTDGVDAEPLSLPEGAHLRLDPNLDLATLHLPKVTMMMAEAAQRYGIVVRDKAANVAFYGEDPIPTGANPYIGAHGFYEGKSAQRILEAFPWSHLQLLKMELHNES